MGTTWWKRLMGGGLSEDEKKLVQALKDAGVTKVNVVGRGTVVTDPDEVVSSDKYKKLASLAREVVK